LEVFQTLQRAHNAVSNVGKIWFVVVVLSFLTTALVLKFAERFFDITLVVVVSLEAAVFIFIRYVRHKDRAKNRPLER
jgi:hypothetical protein